MFSLTAAALRRPRFTLLAALALVLSGLWLALDFPSTEEPQITIRTATVLSLMPGASVERMEQLIARPTEESIQHLSEVKRVRTTVRPGFAFTYVELFPTVPGREMTSVWQKLRSRMNDLRPTLPAGTVGPLVDDEYGSVAVLTMGLTGPGYSAGELREHARYVRDALQRVNGVERVSLHGVRDEQVQILLDVPALGARGISPGVIAQAVARRNVFAPAGSMDVAGTDIALNVTGDAAKLDDLRSTPIPLPGGGAIPLHLLAKVERVAMDPPLTGAFVNSSPAVVIAVSMDAGLNVVSFAQTLRDTIHSLETGLPAGMSFVPITDQAHIVTQQLDQVGHVFMETTVIVMAVVVVFLGLRTGLIVGAIVPTTVLGVLGLMRLLGIDLHIISIGAIIIALGLFVDNAIVVAEDMERRLSLGETAESAAAAAGRSMFVPLLVSSLAISLTFMPLVLSQTEIGEYLRSLGVVLSMALLLSLLLAMTVTPLLCQRFARHHVKLSRTAQVVETLTGWYRGRVRWVLKHKAMYVGNMLVLLGLSLWLFSHIPSELMPASARKQLQLAIELSPDASRTKTLETAQAISLALSDRQAFPEVISHALYMGDGGPRFILALNPPTPAAHRAYAVLTLDPNATHAAAMARLRSGLSARFPDVRFEPKRFSMGSSDAGLAVMRLTSVDGTSHRAAADKLLAALQLIPGIEDAKTDADHDIRQLDVHVDQAKALAAHVSTADIASSLQMLLDGSAVAQYRDGDTVLPVLLRGPGELRTRIEQLAALPVQTSDGSGHVPLGQVAQLKLVTQPAVIERYNQQRAVTVSARHPQLTAQGIIDRLKPVLNDIRASGRVEVALAGEIEENADANATIMALLPVCVVAMFLLFILQFDSVRKSLIIMASIPFVCIGAALALSITGITLTFVGTLGLLALAGIIVNNGVLLLDAIEDARRSGLPGVRAIEEAAAKRLRPIVMTSLVCILGLLPLGLFGGVIWTSLAVVMMGGLALGTLITLGLIPALYAIAYRVPANVS